MRLRPLQSLLLALALLLVLAPHVACTAIGALIGTGLDAIYSHPRVIPAGEAATVPRGKPMVVTQRDGKRIAGAYRDTTTLGDSAYAGLWRRWESAAQRAQSVAPGDPITVVDASGEWSATFAGYHYRSIVVAPLPDGAPKRVLLSNLRMLRGPNGYESSGEALAALDANWALPSRLALVIGLEPHGRGITEMVPSKLTVPCSEIRSISLDRRHVGRNVGALVGMVGDVIILAGLAYSATASDDSGCDNSAIRYSSLERGLPSGIELTTQPFDRYAGRMLQPPADAAPAAAHAAAALGGPAAVRSLPSH
ncbi:MAG: hypothetical protein ABIU54_13350 [Candidatus Eisenbacteria bacterium]